MRYLVLVLSITLGTWMALPADAASAYPDHPVRLLVASSSGSD